MKFGVVVFPGSNCDADAYYAVRDILKQPVEYIWHQTTNVDGFDCIILPGGFSYGDYLRSLTSKEKERLLFINAEIDNQPDITYISTAMENLFPIMNALDAIGAKVISIETQNSFGDSVKDLRFYAPDINIDGAIEINRSEGRKAAKITRDGKDIIITGSFASLESRVFLFSKQLLLKNIAIFAEDESFLHHQRNGQNCLLKREDLQGNLASHCIQGLEEF